MCGRFSQTSPAKTIADFFQTLAFSDYKPSYNIAPTQKICTILVDLECHARVAAPLMWGLVPHWASPKIAAKLTNARAETLSEKPSFRAAYRYRRCIIPVDGFFEWRRDLSPKKPFYFHATDAMPLAFAGLWESWTEPQGAALFTCTIITTHANALMEPIHHRMPVILDPSNFELWLDPTRNEPHHLQPLLKPCAPGILSFYPVSSYVNSSRNQGRKCIEPLDDTSSEKPPEQLSLFP